MSTVDQRTGSFPFFAISQDLGVPYREVLAIADTIEKIGPFDPVIIGKEVYCHVEQAVLVERTRRLAFASRWLTGGARQEGERP
jgi:ribosomal protein S7